MYVQMNCVIVDADNTNREELAAFLVRFGALPVAQFPNVEPLAGVLGKPDGPLLAIVNLDPNPADCAEKDRHPAPAVSRGQFLPDEPDG